MPTAIEIVGDLANRLMQLAQRLTIGFGVLAAGTGWTVGVSRHEAEDPAQETILAFDAGFIPIHVLFRWRRKKRIEPASIRSILLCHFVRIDHVAFGLRHCRTIFEDHALREQVPGGFPVFDNPYVA